MLYLFGTVQIKCYTMEPAAQGTAVTQSQGYNINLHVITQDVNQFCLCCIHDHSLRINAQHVKTNPFAGIGILMESLCRYIIYEQHIFVSEQAWQTCRTIIAI